MPWHDQWGFVYGDYLRFLDGRYSLSRWFYQTNEHRLLTTRVVLFADALFFEMRGYFPVAVMYAALAAIAAMLTRLARPRDPYEQAALFFVMLGTAWSIAQFRDLSWAYEVGFPLVHLFALASLYGFALAVTSEHWTRLLWLALALIGSYLCLWSLGSGLFLIIPLIALCLWLRAANFVTLAFFVGQAILVLDFLSDFRFDGRHPGYRGFERTLELVLRFIGWPFRNPSYDHEIIGAIGLGLFVLLAVAATSRAIFRRQDLSLAVLVAFMLFPLIEASLLAYTRPRGASSRHGTMMIMFLAASIAATWRWLSLTAIPHLRYTALVMAMFVLIGSNRATYENMWRHHAKLLDIAIGEARAGRISKNTHRWLGRWPWIPGALERMRREKVGPFADPLYGQP
jgi:hypothetical protein